MFRYFKRRKAERLEEEERLYQIILEDWKDGVKRTRMGKPRQPQICLVLTYYLNPKKNLEYQAQFTIDHPRKPHWHYPSKVRKRDFLQYLNEAPPGIIEKLKYQYESNWRS